MSTAHTAPQSGAPAEPPLQPNWAPYTRVAGIFALAGFGLWLAVGLAALGADPHGARKHFALSYLSGFIYWVSLPLGGMNLLMIGYLCKTSWALLLRRPFEAAIRTFPLFMLLFVPILIVATFDGITPYWWATPEETETPNVEVNAAAEPGNKREQTIKVGELMIKKAVEREREERDKGIYGFLSKPWFIGTTVILFAVWSTMIFGGLLRLGKDASDETDTGKVDRALQKLVNFSGPGIIIYALSTTAAATLWVMSLEPSWSSTMFPVIYAVNQFLTCFAFCLAVFLTLMSRPPFRDLVRPKFQLDMGTLMLAFTLFWSYTSFSQFMLVWIGNLPEEIPFFLKRSALGWWWVSAALIALHFALPFLLLLFRDVKLHPARLRAVACFLCVICAVDVIWWIEPSMPNPHGYPYFLMDVGAVLGVGGLFAAFWIQNLKKRPLFPASQAFLLPEGHHYHGHH